MLCCDTPKRSATLVTEYPCSVINLTASSSRNYIAEEAFKNSFMQQSSVWIIGMASKMSTDSLVIPQT